MRPARYVTVEPPSAHEGVGNALRATYAPVINDLPRDIAGLMDQLDRL